MEPISTLALLGASLGAGAAGQGLGFMSADSAARRAANQEKGGYQNAAMQQWLQQGLQDEYLRPYADAGLDALPLLQFLTTGQRPEFAPLSEAENAELADLMTRLPELQRIRNMSSSSATGSRSTQRYLAGQVAGIDKQLSRLSDLQNRQRMGQAAEQIQRGDFMKSSPLYDWQEEIGTRGINRDMAARGMFGSSAATNRLADFRRALGAEETERKYGRLAGLIDMGRGGANTYVGARGNTAGNLGNLAINVGNTNAGYTVDRGNARASLYGGLGSLPMQGLSLYNMRG